MKKMITLAMLMVVTITANAMSYSAAKNEALFLSDKMAYELNLTDAQYDAVYEINLDYLMSVNGRNDVFGTWWNRRNTDLQYVLTAYQYNSYMAVSYFYRPLAWNAGGWTMGIYGHYDRARFYKTRPTVFVSYKGGNNRKADRYYADRNVGKPAPAPKAKGNAAPAPKPNNSGSAWRNTASNGNGRNVAPATNRNSGNSSIDNNRQMAQNSGKTSHFGGRR